MERTYTNVGKSEATPEQIDRAIETLEWIEPKGKQPMAQGMAISEVIVECRIPKVSHIAIHGMIYRSELQNPYGFYGIKAQYKNGKASIYIMDTGCEVIIMASDFEEI